MPSTSKKQHNLMAAVAKNPAFAKKAGIKKSVGQDFLEADKGRKFGTGGDVNYTYGGKGQINKQRTRGGSIFGVQKNVPNESLNKYIGKKEGGTVAKMKHDDIVEDKKLIKKAFKMHDAQEHKGSKTDLSKLKKGGCVKKMADGGNVEGFDWASLKVTPREETITERVPARKMDQGERPRMVRKTGPNWTDMRLSGGKSALEDGQKGMGNMGEEPERIGWKKGGSVSSASKRADGCATKGKTKGTMVKMCGGGKAKKMASGGLAAGHKSADGIATKGKTRGTEVKMKKGGKC